ncbi:MAG TPA: hypothetical protein VM243_03260 [Phycisphaerae bacterium]|nr:hypothetical protein [Phycisphaerae bacterium]
MADQPMPPVSGRAPAAPENWQDYAGAMRTIRAARGLFLLLLLLSLLTHGTVYALARWTQFLPATEAVQQEVQAPAPEQAPGTIDLEEPVQRFAWLYYLVKMLLPLSEFVGQLACGALLLCYLLNTNVALLGRLGGVRGSLSAFFWMLVLLALLFPWHRWLGEASGQMQVPGVYLTFDEVTHLPTEFADRPAEVLHYVRFLGYPLLVLLIALVGDRRYAKGYRLAQRQVEARLQVQTV